MTNRELYHLFTTMGHYILHLQIIILWRCTLSKLHISTTCPALGVDLPSAHFFGFPQYVNKF